MEQAEVNAKGTIDAKEQGTIKTRIVLGKSESAQSLGFRACNELGEKLDVSGRYEELGTDGPENVPTRSGEQRRREQRTSLYPNFRTIGLPCLH